jgi:hypothetical protein
MFFSEPAGEVSVSTSIGNSARVDGVATASPGAETAGAPINIDSTAETPTYPAFRSAFRKILTSFSRKVMSDTPYFAHPQLFFLWVPDNQTN